MNGIESTGANQILRNLQKVAEAQTEIARRAVLAGTGVLARECRDASPGTTKQEVGRFVKAEGAVATGRAGLMKLPKRGQTGRRPHGYYLDQGTKFIRARHYIGNALAASRSRAAAAMERSIERSIETVVSQP